jgi:glycosyltransferase involved in cell wall biosynthesis
MRVSVIITVYNVERYIERCISSILNQTYKDFELLVVNDGTPDRSMAIAENFASNDKRIRIVNHGDNVGLMCARRRGYVEAKGDYIFFVDSDDTIPENGVAPGAQEVIDNTPVAETPKGEDIILVADDSEVIRIFVKKIFDAEYELAFATNGDEALNIIKEHLEDNRIKAILLDLNMPVKDGFAVLDFLKENNLLGTMPVTIVSGDSSKEAIDKAFTYNIVDMLSKPFNEAKIKEVVERTIESKK